MAGKDKPPKRGRSNSDDDVQSDHSENVISLLQGLNSKMDVLNATVNDNSVAIKDIDTRLTAKIDKLESSVAENINRVKTEMDSRLLSITNDIDNRFAKANEETASNIVNLQQYNDERFNNLERELLRNEIIVTGVPASHGEIVINIVGDIVNAINSNINGGDIVSAFRIPTTNANMGRNRNGRSSGYSAPIIVRLSSDWAKQDFISAYFKKKNLNTSDIGYQSNARIYVNESLTKHNRAIFKAATEAKKSRSITKCYTRNGIVHIQLQEEGKIYRVNCIDHLSAIISSKFQKSMSSGPLSTSGTANLLDPSTAPTGPTNVLQTNATTTPGMSNAVHNGVPNEGK